MKFKPKYSCLLQKRVRGLEVSSYHQESNQLLKQFCSVNNAVLAAVAECTAGFYWGFFPLVAALCSGCQGDGKGLTVS